MTYLVAAGNGVDDNGVLWASRSCLLLHGCLHCRRGGGSSRWGRRFALCVAEHVLSLALKIRMGGGGAHGKAVLAFTYFV